MIDPTKSDIGRRVLYHPGSDRFPDFRDPEEGVITSFNEHYVFVRYGRDSGSKATRRDALNWAIG